MSKLQLGIYFSRQETLIQQSLQKSERDNLIRLTLARGLQMAAINGIHRGENEAILEFANKYPSSFPFKIPPTFTEKNLDSYLKKLKSDSYSGFSDLTQLIKPPPAPIKPEEVVLGDNKVKEDYVYLEKPIDSETRNFVQKQENYSSQVTENLPYLESIRELLTELQKQLFSPIKNVTSTPHGIYYLKTTGFGSAQLFWRAIPESKEEKTLLDPNLISNSESKDQYSIEHYYPSSSGRYVAVNLIINGDSLRQELRIIDTQANPPRTIEIIPKLASQASWLPDESGLLYRRHPDQIKVPFGDLQIRLHLLGRRSEKDRLLFNGETKDFPSLYAFPNSRHVIFTNYKDVASDKLTIRTVAIEDLKNPQIQWKEIADLEKDRVAGFSLQKDDLYLLTHKNPFNNQPKLEDSHGMILKVSLKNPNPSLHNREAVQIFIPPTDKILSENFAAQPNFFYFSELESGTFRAKKTSYNNPMARHELQLPPGDVANLDALHLDPRMPTLSFTLHRWAGTASHYLFDPEVFHPSPLYLEGERATASLPIQSKIISGKDPKTGQPYFITLLYKEGKEPKLDGKNKMYLEGYSAYGQVYKPHWLPGMELRRLALIKKDWIIAIYEGPGGGAFGPQGHEAGMLHNKSISQSGFLAALQDLQTRGYSSPALTVIGGKSAGGYLVGWALAQAPSLFSAFTLDSGVTDGLSMHKGGTGLFNKTEFGDPTKKEEFLSVKESSPYHLLTRGNHYPTGIFVYGSTDNNLLLFHALKEIAFLQSSSPENIAYLLQTSCGHVYRGCTNEQIIEIEAKVIAGLEAAIAKGKK